MKKGVLFIASMCVVLSACGTRTATSVPAHPQTGSSQQREVRSISGSGSGHFKLVVGVKIVQGGECMPGADQWYLPNSSFVTLDGAHSEAFYSLSTMTLTDTSPVTFTSSVPSSSSAQLIVSSSSNSYSPVGTWSGNVWTPPSAGTYYAGFAQEWVQNEFCSQYTEYDDTLSLSWTT